MLPFIYAGERTSAFSPVRSCSSEEPLIVQSPSSRIRHVLARPVPTPAMVSDALIAAVVFVSVSLSFPCFLYGAYYIIETEPVTWGVLVHHLKFVGTGLTLTTVPTNFRWWTSTPHVTGSVSMM